MLQNPESVFSGLLPVAYCGNSGLFLSTAKGRCSHSMWPCKLARKHVWNVEVSKNSPDCHRFCLLFVGALVCSWSLVVGCFQVIPQTHYTTISNPIWLQILPVTLQFRTSHCCCRTKSCPPMRQGKRHDEKSLNEPCYPLLATGTSGERGLDQSVSKYQNFLVSDQGSSRPSTSTFAMKPPLPSDGVEPDARRFINPARKAKCYRTTTST